MVWLMSFCFLALTVSFQGALSKEKATEASSKKAEEKNSAKSSITFEKAKLKIKKINVSVEIAENPEQHAQGLMHRPSLGKNEGMLFIFPDEDYRSFWMKNTIIDLDIGYFDKSKKLIEVIQMKATSVLETRLPSYPSRAPAMYALEMNKNWFSKNKIKAGEVFELDRRLEK